MTMTPQRIQLSRKKGFDLQEVSRKLNGLPAVNCSRPGVWGNPFKVIRGSVMLSNNRAVVELYRRWFDSNSVFAGGGWDRKKPTIESVRRELRGKNLACWCGPRDYCHADTLLLIANT